MLNVTLLLALAGCADSTAILVRLDGRVQSYVDQAPIAGAAIRFEDHAGVLAGEATTGADGTYSAAVILPYDRVLGADVFASIDHEDFALTSAHQTFRMADFRSAQAAAIPGRLAEARPYAMQPFDLAGLSDRDGTVRGRVFNAVIANQTEGIPDLDLTFREGIDATESSPVMAATVTGPNGEFVVRGLPVGTYTAFIAGGDGWAEARFTVVSVAPLATADPDGDGIANSDEDANGNGTPADDDSDGDGLADYLDVPDQNGATSTALEADQFRVVLSWGLLPADIDAHLSGPLSNGVPETADAARFHVYWSDQTYPDGAADGNGATVFLDVDDTTFEGPETITVRQIEPGTYRYALHDYTNKDAMASDQLSRSRAKVQLFMGTGESETFYIPAGVPGTVWQVFEIGGDPATAYYVSNFAYASDPMDPLLAL